MGTTKGRERAPGKEPVQALRVWRYGPHTKLYGQGCGDSRVRVFRLGQGPDSDIRVTPDLTFEDGPEIGNVHCTIVCTPERVTVCDIAAAGPTWVNDICVVNGSVEVRPGNVITVGTVQLVVCGDDPNQQPDITAPDVPTLIAKTKQMYRQGDGKVKYGKVADALKVPRQTFYGWVRSGRYGLGAAIVCLAAGGLYWSLSSDTHRSQTRTVPAAAAGVPVEPASTAPSEIPEPSPSAPAQLKPTPSTPATTAEQPTRQRAREPSISTRRTNRQSSTAARDEVPAKTPDPVEQPTTAPLDSPSSVTVFGQREFTGAAYRIDGTLQPTLIQPVTATETRHHDNPSTSPR